MKIIQQYIDAVNKEFQSGRATEHSYRGLLKDLIEAIVPEVHATNEPKRSSCGAPDYIVEKSRIPVGYIEAKDIGKDLDHKSYKEQFDRYKKSLENLIITDYLEFQYFKQGEPITSIRIGKVVGGKVVSEAKNFEEFKDFIVEFCTYIGQTIKSASKLAKMMAGKARMLENVIENALNSNDANDEDQTLKEQMEAFKNILIHDIKISEFADIYAQTIAYGMFAARLHDDTPDSFSRQEAATLIPKTNPFLRKLFQYISGYDIDTRIEWIVDALADVFRATNIGELLKDFGQSTQQTDPIIHFYETFLSEYNPKLRKQRGVWYTPEPVVNFIVRAVDDILKDEFGLSEGLADTSKTEIEVDTQTVDKRSKTGYKREKVKVHKVQILDPATGTGTFLAEVIKQIHSKFEGQQGIWSQYVENDLIPRLNGFELLMASYAMAHLKLDLLLKETGFKPKKNNRLKVYLTNSLEEAHPDTGTLFASWLSQEASEANEIKRDTPVMVILGNPPYAVSSTNKGEWIQNLLVDYKKNLNEKKINLDDDYIKFIRYGQYFIDKNGEGILAYISNNSFIDGVTHRQMRKTLLESFDKTYILDLHGSTKRNEKAPDGSKDENVFDIQQGVSINIFIKKGNSKKGQILHSELFGSRESKYTKIFKSTIGNIKWKKLKLSEPYYFFIPKNTKGKKEYDRGFQLNNLLHNYNSGIQTKCDPLSIKFSKEEIELVINNFKDLEINELKSIYNRKKESSGWNFKNAKESLQTNCTIQRIQYRPFDNRYLAYTSDSSGFIGRPRFGTMKHIIDKDNTSLICSRLQSTFDFQHIICTKLISDLNSVSLQSKEQSFVFPLYLYPETENLFSKRVPNLNNEVVDQIAGKTGLQFIPEKEGSSEKKFAPIDLLDYIYAVLHSPSYREKYKEFLKIDFPRIPYPKDAEKFWKLVKLGSQIREIHLLESKVVDKPITSYPEDGDNIITTKIGKKDWEITDEKKGLGRIWINENQYFDKIPVIAWEFYIGGYQPAQKWLKDRQERELSYEDIKHYQKIIVALTETDRLMKEIDKIKFL